MTSATEIKSWFDQAEKDGATHMLVVCDQFDYEDYSVPCNSLEEAQQKVAEPGDMQKVMEVYDISLGWEAQATGMSWNLPEAAGE